MTLVPFLPPPGVFSDDTTFSSEGRWVDADGFRFVQGRAETIEAFATSGASVTVAEVNKLLVYSISGTDYIAAAGTALSHITLPTYGTVTTITPAAGWTGQAGHCLHMWGDELLASCSGGKLFKSVAGAQATEITQAPDNITCMIVSNERQVLALGCNEEVGAAFNGRCIRGCDIEDYTDWTTSPTNNAFEHILPGQANIVSGTVFGTYILVWTEDALWLGQFIGDPGQTYRFDRIEGSVGLAGLDAFAILGGVVYWISPALTFHTYSLGGSVQAIPCPISKTFVDNAMGGLPSVAFACPVVRYQEVWFSYGDVRDAPQEGALCSRYLVYCAGESARVGAPVWARGTWGGLVGGAVTTFVGHMIDSPLNHTSNQLDIYVARRHAGVSEKIYRAQQSTNGPAGSFIQSADWYLDESQRRMMIRGFVPDFEYQSSTVTLAVSARDRPSSTASTGSYSIATSATKKDFRKSGKIVSVKFTPITNARLRLGKPMFDAVPTGER